MKINKDILYALLVVLLISAFAFAVGNVIKKNSENQIAEIIKLQEFQKSEMQRSEQRERTANFKSDSAFSVLQGQQYQISLLNKNFSNLNFNILSMKNMYEKDYNDLKNIQNESDHVINAPVNEQYDFITKYRYKEYSGGSNP